MGGGDGRSRLVSHRLFDDICALGWHPLLRIRASGTVKRTGQEAFEPLKGLVPADGSVWAGEVLCFARQPLACTLLAVQAPGHQEIWLLVTDLPVGQAEATWYGMRYWIEPSFRQFKRGGWQWHASRMQDARRVERSLLVLTVSTLWSMSAAPQAQQQEPASPLDTLPTTHVARTRKTRQSQPAV